MNIVLDLIERAFDLADHALRNINPLVDVADGRPGDAALAVNLFADLLEAFAHFVFHFYKLAAGHNLIVFRFFFQRGRCRQSLAIGRDDSRQAGADRHHKAGRDPASLSRGFLDPWLLSQH